LVLQERYLREVNQRIRGVKTSFCHI